MLVLKVSTGTKGILKTCGVGGGRVLVFKTVEGRWTGDSAANMYNRVLKPALKKRYPSTKTYIILEDNDPTGNKSPGKCVVQCSLWPLPVPVT